MSKIDPVLRAAAAGMVATVVGAFCGSLAVVFSPWFVAVSWLMPFALMAVPFSWWLGEHESKPKRNRQGSERPARDDGPYRSAAEATTSAAETDEPAQDKPHRLPRSSLAPVDTPCPMCGALLSDKRVIYRDSESNPYDGDVLRVKCWSCRHQRFVRPVGVP